MGSLTKSASIGVLVVIVVIACIFSAVAFAEKRRCLRQTAVAVAAAAPTAQQPMTPIQVRLALEKAGYGRVHEIRVHGRNWRAQAVNSQGERVGVWFETASGQVVREMQEDCQTAAQTPDASFEPPVVMPLEDMP